MQCSISFAFHPSGPIVKSIVFTFNCLSVESHVLLFIGIVQQIGTVTLPEWFYFIQILFWVGAPAFIITITSHVLYHLFPSIASVFFAYSLDEVAG